MTGDEVREARRLLAGGMLHARMQPLLEAALDHITQNPYALDLRHRLELSQLLTEIGVKADIPQQDALFLFVKAGFTAKENPCDEE